MRGTALGREALVDHDELRRDPVTGGVIGGLLGRLEAGHGRCAPLAGNSTLNRLAPGTVAMPAVGDRYRRIAPDPASIERLFVDVFRRAHAEPQKQIVRDPDRSADPPPVLARGKGHGQRQGRVCPG